MPRLLEIKNTPILMPTAIPIPIQGKTQVSDTH